MHSQFHGLASLCWSQLVRLAPSVASCAVLQHNLGQQGVHRVIARGRADHQQTTGAAACT